MEDKFSFAGLLVAIVGLFTSAGALKLMKFIYRYSSEKRAMLRSEWREDLLERVDSMKASIRKLEDEKERLQKENTKLKVDNALLSKK